MNLTRMTDENAIDWSALWRELNWDDTQRREETNRQRLQQRARQYASVLNTDMESAADLQPMLAFQLGEERCAIDVTLVRAVRALSHITPVPGVPTFYRGVVNLRGRITSVLDLRLFFDMPVLEAAPPQELIVVQANRLEIGLLAHTVEGVVEISMGAFEPQPDIRYARGITRDKLLLLDLARLFEDERLIVGGSLEDRMER